MGRLQPLNMAYGAPFPTPSSCGGCAAESAQCPRALTGRGVLPRAADSKVEGSLAAQVVAAHDAPATLAPGAGLR